MSDVEDYIKKNVFGKPQVKPDEKRKFLGNFRERVALALTIAQVESYDNLSMIEKVMKQYPEDHMYINGRMSSIDQSHLIKLSVKLNYKFTIIRQANMRSKTKPLRENDMGIVIANEHKPNKKPVLI